MLQLRLTGCVFIMTSDYKHSLSGLSQVPINGESSFSALTRLSWFNELQRSALWNLITSKSGGGSQRSFLSPDWINQNVLFENTGWVLPQAVEQRIGSLGFFAEHWFSPTLRLCPICFELGYHCIWFQLKGLQCCPLHACEIKDKCQSCGRPLPAYRFTPDLFDNPYYCKVCRSPLSGAPTVLRFGDEIKEVLASRNAIFLRYLNWLYRFDVDDLKHNCLSDRLTSMTELRMRGLETALGERYNPLPPDCFVPLYSAPKVIQWNIQMRDSQYSRPKLLRYPGSAMLDKVLRTVLRRLEYWIFEDTGGRVPEDIRYRMSQMFCARSVDDLAPAIAAYIFFTDLYVSGASYDQSKTRVNTYLRRLPTGSMPYLDITLTRTVFRNLLFCVFAEIYSGIITSRSKHTMMPWRLGYGPSGYMSSLSSSGLARGFVAFPDVQGLPVSAVPPWRTSSSMRSANAATGL